MDKTKEVVTVHIPKSSVEELNDATGAWPLGDDTEAGADLIQDEYAELATIDRPLKYSLKQRIGQAAYWLTHRNYRREVRERANLIAQDLANGMPEKTLLPPRSRDFHVVERRRRTAEFALDIKRQIRLMRMMGQITSMLTLALNERPYGSSYSNSATPSPADLPEVEVVEMQTLPLKGYGVGDSDFVPKVVIKE